MDTKTKLKYYPFLTNVSPLARHLAKFFLEDQRRLVVDTSLRLAGNRPLAKFTKTQGIQLFCDGFPSVTFPIPKVLDLGDYCRIKGDLRLERVPHLQQIICKKLVIEGSLEVGFNDQLSSIICDELVIEQAIVNRKMRWSYHTRGITIKHCHKLKNLPTKISSKKIEFNNISIQSLPQFEEEIKELNIYSCSSLKNFPAKLEAEDIDIHNCPSITSLPKIIADSLIVGRCPNLRQISKDTQVSHLSLSGKMELNHVPGRIQLEADSLDIPKKLRLQLEKTPKKGVYKNIQKAKKKPKCVKNSGRRFR